jgi:hypothetical protein
MWNILKKDGRSYRKCKKLNLALHFENVACLWTNVGHEVNLIGSLNMCRSQGGRSRRDLMSTIYEG